MGGGRQIKRENPKQASHPGQSPMQASIPEPQDQELKSRVDA